MAPIPGESLPGDVSSQQITGIRVESGWAVGLSLDASDKWHKIMYKMGVCLSLPASIVTSCCLCSSFCYFFLPLLTR